MKVWVTKYALTAGVEEIEVDYDEHYPNMVTLVAGKHRHQFFHGEGKEWHRTREGAIAAAETMRQAKIKSLQKQLARLEKLSFGGRERHAGRGGE